MAAFLFWPSIYSTVLQDSTRVEVFLAVIWLCYMLNLISCLYLKGSVLMSRILTRMQTFYQLLIRKHLYMDNWYHL